jgi:hypothetical protein
MSRRKPQETPRLIDPRFLSVHPRTLLWWKEREQCSACAHLDSKPIPNERGTGMVMHCKATAPRVRDNGRVDYSACISARDPGAACGPAAALFVPRENT